MHSLNDTKFTTSVLVLSLFSSLIMLSAQSIDIQLDEVRITGSRKSLYANDLHTVRIDTLLKTKYFGDDLSHILARETNLNITQYGGQGSLASIRLRGSAPSQTQFNWNGVPVNSPTTGSIDLSLLSGGMADAIEIAYGASGSLFGNGTFGGSINLFNSPDWDNRFSLNIGGEAGSWNHFKSGLNLKTGSKSFQYHLSGVYQSSPNNYSYQNSFKAGNPVEHRLNDSMNMQTVQQHIFLRLPKNWYVQYGAWWHNRNKQLPASMSSAPMFTAFQTDRSMRQFARATKWFRKSSLEMVAAYFIDSLLYKEKLIAADSIIKQSGITSSNTYLSIYYRWFLSTNLTLENGADYEYQTAKVEAYNGFINESRGAIFSLLKYTVKQLSANISYRQVFYSMTGPKPLFSAAVQYHLPGNGLSVKGQISNKFRFPTLNDRYWQPGGNRNLLPESGIGYDLGFNWDTSMSSHSSISMSSMLFFQKINNWIQWVPLGTYWSPQNIRQVLCQGAELDLSGKWKIGSFGLMAKMMYAYTESLDGSLPESRKRYSRQLAYVPLHLFKLQSGINLHQLEVNLSYKYTGRRYTTDDHDSWLDLDPYHLVDFSVGYTFSAKTSKIILSATANNLFNTQFQLIRGYPAPGRSFYLSANYFFNQKSKNNE